MAAGDITLYANWLLAQADGDAGGKLSGTPVDFNSDTLKVVILDSTFVPDTLSSTIQEHFDDISAKEVTTGTSYTGPITLASITVTESSGVVTFDAANIAIVSDATTGFTDGRHIVIYKDTGTPATSPLIMTGDLGTDRNIQVAELDFNWSASGIVTWTKV